MMNIGIRPTIKDNLSLAIEVHILDFNENIYGSPIKVKLISRLRDEKKFNSIDELKKQLQDDEKNSRAFFNTIPI